jgi:uncharacterized protein YaaQ
MEELEVRDARKSFLTYVVADDDIGSARQMLEAEPYLATAEWSAAAFRVAGSASFMAGNEDDRT